MRFHSQVAESFGTIAELIRWSHFTVNDRRGADDFIRIKIYWRLTNSLHSSNLDALKESEGGCTAVTIGYFVALRNFSGADRSCRIEFQVAAKFAVSTVRRQIAPYKRKLPIVAVIVYRPVNCRHVGMLYPLKLPRHRR